MTDQTPETPPEPHEDAPGAPDTDDVAVPTDEAALYDESAESQPWPYDGETAQDVTP